MNEGTKGLNIVRLITSFYFMFEHAFIVISEGNYRLICAQNGRIYTDANYSSIRGAKIAFLKMHGHRISKMVDEKLNGSSAQWSHQYPPDPKWLNEILCGEVVDS